MKDSSEESGAKVNLLENLGIENSDATISKEAINAAIESHLSETGCVEANNNLVVGANQNASEAGTLDEIVKEMDVGAFSNEDTKRVLSEKQIEIVKASSEVSGSLSDEKFDISFNLDAFSPKVSSSVEMKCISRAFNPPAFSLMTAGLVLREHHFYFYALSGGEIHVFKFSESTGYCEKFIEITKKFSPIHV